MLANYANEKNECYPSIQTLANDVETTKNTIRNAIQKLESIGLIVKSARVDGERQTSHLYTLNVGSVIPAPSQATAPPSSATAAPMGVTTERGSVIPALGSATAAPEPITYPITYPEKNIRESSDDDLFELDKNKRVKKIPYQEIVDLYHKHLPNNPQVFKLTATRKAQIKARWNDPNELPTLQDWEDFFIYISKNKFLTGRSPPSNGRKPFIAGLEWLTKESNFTKIAENNYA